MRKIVEAFTRVDFKAKVPWSLIGVFVFLSLGITLAGILYFNQQKDQINKNKRGELAAIADLKVQHIVSWRKERLGDTRMAQSGGQTL